MRHLRMQARRENAGLGELEPAERMRPRGPMKVEQQRSHSRILEAETEVMVELIRQQELVLILAKRRPKTFALGRRHALGRPLAGASGACENGPRQAPLQ